ncbi:MAG TPA: fluoride efflux transporter CrcB [Candidatus Limnocylindrales bacterium]
MQLLLVGLGGFGGAVLRWLVDGWVSERNPSAFPLGTFVVNLTGSFVLGVLFAWVLERDVLPPDVRLPLMVGFLGAYTTFSTFMLESWRLVEEGAYGLAMANLVGSVVLGLVAVVAGLAVGRLVP